MGLTGTNSSQSDEGGLTGGMGRQTWEWEQAFRPQSIIRVEEWPSRVRKEIVGSRALGAVRERSHDALSGKKG